MGKNNFLGIISFFIFPGGVFLFNLFLILINAYDYIPNLDIPMHFTGGLAIAYTTALFLKLFSRSRLIKINNELLFIFIVVSVVSLTAVLWEFFEFLLKVFFNIPVQFGLNDTLMDLLMGILGGFIGGCLFKNL